MSKDSNKSYKFTWVNNTVSAVYEVKNGRTKLEKIDRNETWTLSGANVVKTESEHGRIESTVYSDIDGDGFFTAVSKSYGAALGGQTAPAATNYQFDVANGRVTAVYEIKSGVVSQERMDSNETWTIDGNSVIKTEIERGLTETSIYTDAQGDGTFVRATKTYTATNGTVWNGTTGSDTDDAWTGSSRDDNYYAGSGQDHLAGGAGNDDMYGADGSDRLLGDTGNDDLYGGNGDDSLSGGDGVDHLEGGLDNDALEGGAGNDYLSGGAGIDLLTGGTGDDDLYGEDGNDTLAGGAGSDDLYGGAGNDNFKFTSVSESGLTAATRDRILDFKVGDKIDLSAIDAKAGFGFNDAFTYIGAASNLSAANANGAVWLQNGTLYASNDRDTAAEFQVELVGTTQLTAADFVL